MTYRKLPTDVALNIMERCDTIGINWDVWNAEGSITGSDDYTELGLSSWDDEIIQSLLSDTNLE